MDKNRTKMKDTKNMDMLRIQRLDLKLRPANIRGSQVKRAVWKFVAKAGT